MMNAERARVGQEVNMLGAEEVTAEADGTCAWCAGPFKRGAVVLRVTASEWLIHDPCYGPASEVGGLADEATDAVRKLRKGLREGLQQA